MGTDKAATIADGTTFILEDGATWTAKVVLYYLPGFGPSTLIEVSGSRIQTA